MMGHADPQQTLFYQLSLETSAGASAARHSAVH
jgi:hypothetical protein